MRNGPCPVHRRAMDFRRRGTGVTSTLCPAVGATVMREIESTSRPSRDADPASSTREEPPPRAPSSTGAVEVTRPARLIAVDATRGLALLGMMAVHALWAYDDDGNVTWTYSLAAGRSAATFALLAGVGIAFMT